METVQKQEVGGTGVLRDVDLAYRTTIEYAQANWTTRRNLPSYGLLAYLRRIWPAHYFPPQPDGVGISLPISCCAGGVNNVSLAGTVLDLGAFDGVRALGVVAAGVTVLALVTGTNRSTYSVSTGAGSAAYSSLPSSTASSVIGTSAQRLRCSGFTWSALRQRKQIMLFQMMCSSMRPVEQTLL
ncbi:hypothetical protein LTR09_005149 [Extremus antarcticus]|uniref:Uncharacterized protein n=1 Tax=Extremus antarcticus TaxID=702011 RepID=A0AAJ0DPP2_9PEZI|nr:hypothetical protein LTR09_005149 [Extremus antarcticus]